MTLEQLILYSAITDLYKHIKTCPSLFLHSSQRRTDVLATKLDTQRTLHLRHDLWVGLGFAGLVLLNHLGLFVDSLAKILLCPFLCLPGLCDCLADTGCNL